MFESGLALLDDVRDYLQSILPSWLVPGWPPSLKEMAAIGAVSITTLGLSTYLFIKVYCDWIWDDLIFGRGISAYMKLIGGNTDQLYDPAAKLEEHAANIPNKLFLLYEDQKWTYGQTNLRANQIGNALQKLGVTRQQKIAILMVNKPELLFTFYGCLKVAVPLSFLNTNLRTKALIHCIRDAETKNLIVDDDAELLAAVAEIEEELKADGIRVFVYGRTDKYESLTEVIESCDTQLPESLKRGDMTTHDVALYIFTSGTTGLPKAAKISYYRLGRGAAFFCLFGVTADDVAYSPLPLYHSAALMTFNGSSLMMGATFAFAKKFSVRSFWTDCDKHSATVVQYIGETCRYLLSRPPSENDKKHTVRMAIGNGLRKDIWNEFKTRFNIDRIAEFYAATEGNVFFGNFRNRFGSCGRRSPLWALSSKVPKVLFLEYDTENDVVVRGSDGMCKQVPLGTPGLLTAQITSEARFEGYSNSKQTNSKILKNVQTHGDAYFNTGDLLLCDTDYHIYFVDRIGDTFRWKGENVSTQEVGNLVGELDMVQDCSIYGVPITGMDGKCGMGAIVLKTGITPSPDVLKTIYNHCEHYLPSYARPVFIRFMDELHLTGTFKHQKFKLQNEGFNCHTVPDVYVHDVRQGTYVQLTSDVYDSILSGNMKV